MRTRPNDSAEGRVEPSRRRRVVDGEREAVSPVDRAWSGGLVRIWDGEARCASVDHDRVYDER